MHLLDTVLTSSVGCYDSLNDIVFNDLLLHGTFPQDTKIKGPKKIKVYSDKKQAEKAVITGLIIHYDGVDQPVIHGVVEKVDLLGTVDIDSSKHLIVGVYGRLKDMEGQSVHKRINSIGFVLYDKSSGRLQTQEPFEGSSEHRGTPWATFGPVIAFHGTKKDGIGITTLGFLKSKAFAKDNNVNIL